MGGPIIIGLVCHWVADNMEERVVAFSQKGVRIFQFNCLANIPVKLVVEMFRKGVDVVFLLECGNGGCRYYDGNEKIGKTSQALEVMLEDMALEPERIMLARARDHEEDPLGRVWEESIALAKSMGPNPYREEGS